MSFHNNLAEYLRAADPRFCPVCNTEPMPAEMVDVIELPHSVLDAQPVDCLKGACHLVAKRHVLELYELNDDDLLGFMRDAAVCARAIQTVTGAVKMNYEIHGNTTPHLHLHLYPRFMDDPFPGRAIDYAQERRWFAEGEFEAYVARLRGEIERLRSG